MNIIKESVYAAITVILSVVFFGWFTYMVQPMNPNYYTIMTLTILVLIYVIGFKRARQLTLNEKGGQDA